jgi:hypothetical protein
MLMRVGQVPSTVERAPASLVRPTLTCLSSRMPALLLGPHDLPSIPQAPHAHAIMWMGMTTKLEELPTPAERGAATEACKMSSFSSRKARRGPAQFLQAIPKQSKTVN